MATVYSKWVATDDWRVRLVYTVTYPSSTTATVTLTASLQSVYAWSNGHVSTTLTCGSSTQTYTGGYCYTNTTTQQASRSFTVSRSSSSKTVTVKAKCWITNSSYSSYRTGATASATVTIDPIEYSTPYAPSSCSASRSSDSSAKVTWTNGSTTTTRPRTRTYIERQTDAGSWVQKTYVGSSVSSYTDSGISANHRYRYRVRAYNTAGYSSYATSGYIYTTPAAPSSVTIARTGDGTAVQVSAVTSNATYATSWDVQYSVNGGSWVDYGSVTSFPFTFTPDGGTVQVRVRSVRSSMSSGWTTSASIQTIVAPNAPAVTIAGGSYAVATGAVLTVEWVPDHPDGSDQTEAEVEWVLDGSSATESIDGDATSYTLPESASESPATVQARVRTHGVYDGWGAWSSYVSVNVCEPSSVVIGNPAVDDDVVDRLPLDVEWSVYDSTGVASQTLELLDGSGSVLYTLQMDGEVREHRFTVSDFGFENDSRYLIRLTVRAGSTLVTVAERWFVTEWREPPLPTYDISVDEDSLSCEIIVHAGEMPCVSGRVEEAGIVRIQASDDHDSMVDDLRALPSGTYRAVCRFELLEADDTEETPKHGVSFSETLSNPPSWWMSSFTEWSSTEPGTVDVTEREFTVSTTYNYTNIKVFGVARDYDFSAGSANVTVDVYPVDVEGDVEPALPEPEGFQVTRIVDGEQWVVATGMEGDEVCIDPLPPLNVEFTYRISAYTDLGVTSDANVVFTVDSGTRAAYNFDESASVAFVTQFDFEDTEKPSTDGELYHFAGTSYPMFYITQDKESDLSQKFSLIEHEAYSEARMLFRKYAVCWLRTPRGMRYRESMTASFSGKAGSPVTEVSVSGDEIVFEEAW